VLSGSAATLRADKLIAKAKKIAAQAWAIWRIWFKRPAPTGIPSRMRVAALFDCGSPAPMTGWAGSTGFVARRSAQNRVTSAATTDETDDEGKGVPGMKQSQAFRTRAANNPNDWLRMRLVAPEFHCGVPR
jgi:hypothetical protein